LADMSVTEAFRADSPDALQRQAEPASQVSSESSLYGLKPRTLSFSLAVASPIPHVVHSRRPTLPSNSSGPAVGSLFSMTESSSAHNMPSNNVTRDELVIPSSQQAVDNDEPQLAEDEVLSHTDRESVFYVTQWGDAPLTGGLTPHGAPLTGGLTPHGARDPAEERDVSVDAAARDFSRDFDADALAALQDDDDSSDSLALLSQPAVDVDAVLASQAALDEEYGLADEKYRQRVASQRKSQRAESVRCAGITQGRQHRARAVPADLSRGGGRGG